MKKILLAIFVATSLFGNFDEELKNSYKQVEKALPLEITPDISWVKVEIKDKEIHYSYDFKKQMILTELILKNLIYTMCNEPTNKIVISNGYVLVANYFFENKLMSSVKVDKIACNYKD